MSVPKDCPLCTQPGGALLWRNESMRIIHVDDPEYPGYTRVIWNRHVAEMTQLSSGERQEFMDAVWLVEDVQRRILRPDKINLAQFGNMVPHLHWHVIPRWRADSRFPDAVWAPPQARDPSHQTSWDRQRSQLASLLPQYHAALTADFKGFRGQTPCGV